MADVRACVLLENANASFFRFVCWLQFAAACAVAFVGVRFVERLLGLCCCRLPCSLFMMQKPTFDTTSASNAQKRANNHNSHGKLYHCTSNLRLEFTCMSTPVRRSCTCQAANLLDSMRQAAQYL